MLIKNFNIKRLFKKLNYVKVGPFLIIKQTGLVNYQVILLSNTRKH
jgi:hypothetical protein